MLNLIFQILALVAVIIGTGFSVIGIIGLIRLPDVYTRAHASGKVSTFGVVLLLVAAICLTPVGWAKAVLLMVFVLIAGPVISHVIGSVAYRTGIPMKGAIRDDLAEALRKKDSPDFDGNI